MDMSSIVAALVGGCVIGVSAAILLVLVGRIAGISGIVGGLLTPTEGEIGWRLLFSGGLVVGGVVAFLTAPGAFEPGDASELWRLAIAGLLVGGGARLGSGCTSGHGVCGISRLSTRSIVATLTFMTTGGLAVFVMRQLGLLGGGS